MRQEDEYRAGTVVHSKQKCFFPKQRQKTTIQHFLQALALSYGLSGCLIDISRRKLQTKHQQNPAALSTVLHFLRIFFWAWIFKAAFYFLYCILIYMYGRCMHHSRYVEVKGQPVEVSFLLPLCGY